VLDFSYVSPVKKNSVLLGQAIFAKQKTKKAQPENDRRVIKATKEISMQHLILLAVEESKPSDPMTVDATHDESKAISPPASFFLYLTFFILAIALAMLVYVMSH
jgi:hypothetical protein